ncbi:hypothetical protein I7I48_07969 [Histoplasma ohiense]|nr:hypothetical protein I7I48_07969 [Histoplasma ohiense (nom. inval.)]
MISIPPVWRGLSWKMGDGFEVLREHHISRYIISLQNSPHLPCQTGIQSEAIRSCMLKWSCLMFMHWLLQFITTTTTTTAITIAITITTPTLSTSTVILKSLVREHEKEVLMIKTTLS